MEQHVSAAAEARLVKGSTGLAATTVHLIPYLHYMAHRHKHPGGQVPTPA
jgi:hypothetical protein